LRDLKGQTEAKAAAHPASSLTNSRSLHSRLLNEARVYTSARDCLDKRVGSWTYVFEDCYERQRKFDEASNHNHSGDNRNALTSFFTTTTTTTTAAAAAAAAAAGDFNRHSTPSRESSLKANLAYNAALAKHLTDVAFAISSQCHISSAASSSSKSGHEARAKRTANEFRAEEYNRVAKLVQKYPVAVTVECLCENKGGGNKKRGKRSSPSDNKQINSGREPIVSLLHIRSPQNGRIALGTASVGSLPSLPPSAPTPALPSSSALSSPTPTKPPPAGRPSSGPSPIPVSGSTRRTLLTAIFHFLPLHFSAGCNGNESDVLDEGRWKEDMALLNGPTVKALKELTKIWGVGMTTAVTLVSWGIRGIESLRKDSSVLECLNHQQRIGVKHYEDINTKMPRAEVTMILERVRKVVTELSGGKVCCQACGSYRRGAAKSGDIDVLMLPVSEAFEDEFLAVEVFNEVLKKLTDDGFLTDHLTLPNQFNENAGPKPGTQAVSYMGVCLLKAGGTHRRIDLKAYPKSQGSFALCYFTGSAHFNRSLRAFCKRAGLTLSDAGLAMAARDKGKKVKVWESVNCVEEEDIFRALGIGYVRPTFRDVVVGVGSDSVVLDDDDDGFYDVDSGSHNDYHADGSDEDDEGGEEEEEEGKEEDGSDEDL
jgi:DNA polymerase/3'-5' exonuclease PolX